MAATMKTPPPPLRLTRRGRRLGAGLLATFAVTFCIAGFKIGQDNRCHYLQAHHAQAYQIHRYC